MLWVATKERPEPKWLTNRIWKRLSAPPANCCGGTSNWIWVATLNFSICAFTSLLFDDDDKRSLRLQSAVRARQGSFTTWRILGKYLNRNFFTVLYIWAWKFLQFFSGACSRYVVGDAMKMFCLQITHEIALSFDNLPFLKNLYVGTHCYSNSNGLDVIITLWCKFSN